MVSLRVVDLLVGTDWLGLLNGMVENFLKVVSKPPVLLLVLVKMVHSLPQFIKSLCDLQKVIKLVVVEPSLLESKPAVLDRLRAWGFEHN